MYKLPSAEHVTTLVAFQLAQIWEDTSKDVQAAVHKQKTLQLLLLINDQTHRYALLVTRYFVCEQGCTPEGG